MGPMIFQDFNDRLLLGLKGTMSEAELHILAGRLQESKRAAARCGRLRFPLPIGYVYDEDGRTVMDPSEEIRAAVAEVFRPLKSQVLLMVWLAGLQEGPSRPGLMVGAGQGKYGEER